MPQENKYDRNNKNHITVQGPCKTDFFYTL